MSSQTRRWREERGGDQPFISVVRVVGLREEDDGRDGDEAASLPAALHLLQEAGDGGHRDVAHGGVRAGRSAVLPESGLDGDAPDLSLGLRVGGRLTGGPASKGSVRGYWRYQC